MSFFQHQPKIRQSISLSAAQSKLKQNMGKKPPFLSDSVSGNCVHCSAEADKMQMQCFPRADKEMA